DDRLTAEDNLRFHGYLYHMDRGLINKRIAEVMELVELYDRRKDYVKKFSGGMKRRLEIARGLLHCPKLLFLDEPTLGLDPQTRLHIWEYILKMRREAGLSIFMTTHYMEEAEVCDRIAIIDHGKIVDLDTPAKLKEKHAEPTLERVFLKITGREIRTQAGESAWVQWMRRP
ncbi:MAG: ATP-binding cassette domain-containing protein, partial [Candidatus Margulisbacteria bacterium]|nr:ATP-binding cassette domain-containing protein [Candidatus Margulisiibacteriota bacterium]